MFKKQIFISVIIFSLFLIITSFIKNQTRIIEKQIKKTEKKIANLKNDLHETQLDFFYVSSPLNLSKKINELDMVDYQPVDFSNIYLNYSDYSNQMKKITILKKKDEKIKKK